MCRFFAPHLTRHSRPPHTPPGLIPAKRFHAADVKSHFCRPCTRLQHPLKRSTSKALKLPFLYMSPTFYANSAVTFFSRLGLRKFRTHFLTPSKGLNPPDREREKIKKLFYKINSNFCFINFVVTLNNTSRGLVGHRSIGRETTKRKQKEYCRQVPSYPTEILTSTLFLSFCLLSHPPLKTTPVAVVNPLPAPKTSTGS